MTNIPFVRMANITKVYPNGVVANENASLELEKGEIHAVAGENGAGKSTIMKVLYGAEKASGDIFIAGRKCEIDSPRTACSLGIGMVYQHFMLVNEFSVWENIFFGNEIHNAFGILNRDSMRSEAKSLCSKYGMDLDIDAKCKDLSVSQAQKTEILKVLAKGVKVLILDEPTAVLAPQETQQLFTQLLKLKESGYTIVIITHKLNEIKQICDRVTIMRKGRTIGTYNVADVSEDDISRLMVGRDVAKPSKAKPMPGGTVLEVRGLCIAGPSGHSEVKDVDFSVRKGEILCFAGIEGNGQHEVIEAVTGLNQSYSGSISIDGVEVKGHGMDFLRRLGLAHIPEDRLRTGAVSDFSVFENLIAANFNDNSRFGLIEYSALKEECRSLMDFFDVKGSLGDSISQLSGGNMQKVVIARELSTDPCLVVADQPTRGVDIGAIESIHNRIIALRDEGKAVLLVSADLSEVFALADRIIVFHDGEIVACIDDVRSVNEESLGRYMLGLDRMNLSRTEVSNARE